MRKFEFNKEDKKTPKEIKKDERRYIGLSTEEIKDSINSLRGVYKHTQDEYIKDKIVELENELKTR